MLRPAKLHLKPSATHAKVPEARGMGARNLLRGERISLRPEGYVVCALVAQRLILPEIKLNILKLTDFFWIMVGA